MTVSNERIPTPADFERKLTHFINVTLLAGNAAVDRDTRLFEDGYMNSLRILDLIAMVEKTLGRRVADRSVRLANFRTVAAIVSAFHPDAAATAAPEMVASDRVFERRTDRTRFASPVAALEERGDLVVTGPGQVALSGLALDVFDAVDGAVVRWAQSLGAAEHDYPAMIDREVLERAGKLGHSERSEESVASRAIGSPAVCYHAYPEWTGKALGPEPTLLTARGRCYRDEAGHVPLERLQQFTMREIIVLGARDQVEHVRRSLITQVSELVAALGLDASIDVAGDPFFAAGDEGRRLMQQAAALKHELQLAVDASGRSIAAASFNHHYDFFGTRFDIRLADGSPAHSGCVAFGLERWVLGVLAQHGTNDADWPLAVRDWLRDARDTRRAGAGA
ncbi:MAG TPA: aminoacyl--tRNA ligase-related protein [Gemmatimonadaceae bacterium]|nr:aminoacyl--tRNA ligase-related protein [Gemmatimonadaceae bacterium]